MWLRFFQMAALTVFMRSFRPDWRRAQAEPRDDCFAYSLVAYVMLAIPAALIGIPWTLISGDIRFLYRWAMWILRAGVRLAGIRVEFIRRRSRACGSRLYLHGEPCLQPRSADSAPADSGAHLGLHQAVTDEDPGPRLRHEAGRLHSSGPRRQT